MVVWNVVSSFLFFLTDRIIYLKQRKYKNRNYCTFIHFFFQQCYQMKSRVGQPCWIDNSCLGSRQGWQKRQNKRELNFKDKCISIKLYVLKDWRVYILPFFFRSFPLPITRLFSFPLIFRFFLSSLFLSFHFYSSSFACLHSFAGSFLFSFLFLKARHCKETVRR